MRRSDFTYSLPTDLIAQYPAQERSGSRLLDLSSGPDFRDRAMLDLPELLQPGDLLIFNDTRVIPARLFGHKPSGGRVEILVERVTGEREALAQIGASKTPRPGGEILIDGTNASLVMIERQDDLFRLQLLGPETMMELLERVGRLPLPPYIGHAPLAEDRERYQTLFAANPGAVAAPTAGLHFDQTLLTRILARGARTATLTLHVGAGTFQPLRVDDLSLHRMHAERYQIDARLCAALAETRASGGRIVAVGTTVARALESAADAAGNVEPCSGETRLFITPGYRFRALDRLLTNFHLPESTLLMLVCAFGGQERMLAAYRHAVQQRYRFFSYGDAMLIAPGQP